MAILKRRTSDIPKRAGRNNRDFYNSTAWRNLSKQHRKKHPLCAECLRQGVTTAGNCTDHIIPLTEGGEALDSTNLQTLCNRHHSVKTRKENKGWNKTS